MCWVLATLILLQNLIDFARAPTAGDARTSSDEQTPYLVLCHRSQHRYTILSNEGSYGGKIFGIIFGILDHKSTWI